MWPRLDRSHSMSSSLHSHDTEMEEDANPFTPQQPTQSRSAGAGAQSRHAGFSGRQERQPQTPRQAARPGQTPSTGSQSRGTRDQSSGHTRPPSGQPRRPGPQTQRGSTADRPAGSMDSGCPPSDSACFGSGSAHDILTDAHASFSSTSPCDEQGYTGDEVLREVTENVQKAVQKHLDRSMSSSSSKSTSETSRSCQQSFSSDASDQRQGEDLVPMAPELKDYLSDMPSDLRMPYYDAIIVCAEEDTKAVRTFKDLVMQHVLLYNQYKPRVILYDEFDRAGKSEFRILDRALERSTYVFLYVTKSFCVDTWAEHLSDSCLMEAINNPDKQWCVVPIFTTRKRNSEFRIPVSLNSLKGVQYWLNKDSYYLEAVQRLLEDKISIRRCKEEELEKKRRAWLINFQAEEQIRRAKNEQELDEQKAQAADKIRAAMHSSKSVPSFPQGLYAKPQRPNDMHHGIPSCSSFPSVPNSICSMDSRGQTSRVAGETSSMRVPNVAGLNRSASQSTSSVHSSLSSLGSSIQPGVDPTLVQPTPFISLPQNPGPPFQSPSGPMSLPIPEQSEVSRWDDGSWRATRSAELRQERDLTEDSPSSLINHRAPNFTGSNARHGDAGSSVDPPSIPSSSSTPSLEASGLGTGGTPTRNIPVQDPKCQNSPKHSSLPSSLGRARASGSGESTDQDSGPVVRSEIHYHYHYHQPTPALSPPTSSGQTVVYNINNAEVVQIGRSNVVQNSRREPSVFDDETSSTTSSLSRSSASELATSPEKSPEPKTSQTEAVPSDQGENRMPPPHSVVSEDNARSVVGPSALGMNQCQRVENDPTSLALAERGQEQYSSAEDLPAMLPWPGRGGSSQGTDTPDTSLKQTRPGNSSDEPAPTASVLPDKTEDLSQAEKKQSPVTAVAAVFRPSVPGAPLFKGQQTPERKVAAVPPMRREPAADGHHTEVKQPVDTSQTTPKAYHQGEEAITPSDQTWSGERERGNGEEDEEGEKGKGHDASGIGKAMRSKMDEQIPKENTSPSLSTQVAATHPLQPDPSSADISEVKPSSANRYEGTAGVLFREGGGDPTSGDADSAPLKSFHRGADPTLVEGGQKGLRGSEWGPVCRRFDSQQRTRPAHSQGPFQPGSRCSESSPSLGHQTVRMPSHSTSHHSLQGSAPGNSQQQEGSGRGTYPLQSSARNSMERNPQLSRSSQDPSNKKTCRLS